MNYNYTKENKILEGKILEIARHRATCQMIDFGKCGTTRQEVRATVKSMVKAGILQRETITTTHMRSEQGVRQAISRGHRGTFEYTKTKTIYFIG